MSIKQISVFLENKQGSLQAFTRLLGENGVDMLALSIADTTDYGILRAIVCQPEKTLQLVRSQGYTASLTDVLAVAVPDSAGGLSGALAVLDAGGITIEYIYSFVRRIGDAAVIIFRVDKPEEAEALLAAKGIRLLAQGELGECGA